MATAQDVIRVAASQVGFIEGRNNENPYGRWYGAPNQAYCAMFLSWCHGQTNSLDLVNFSTSKGYAWTPAGAEGFRRRGQFDMAPRIGDHVFYDFPGGPNRISHVGLLTAFGPDWIETIEANTSRGSAGSQRDGGGVWRRRRARNSSIKGYGHPAYVAAPPRPEPIQPEREVIRDLQRRMGLRDDGDFGPITAGACNKSVNLIGWQAEVSKKAGPKVGNRSILVQWLKLQFNRKYGENFDVNNYDVGPRMNHRIVVNLGQKDSICGANGYREACR